MNTNCTKGKFVKFNRIAALLAVGIAVSTGAPALAGVLWDKLAKNESMPGNAVKGGSDSGKTLYVCQAIHDGEYTPGKATLGYCYIPWGNKEHVYPRSKYRVLRGNNWEWKNLVGKKKLLPKNPVWGGNENNGQKTLYPCRARHRGAYTPGKYYPPNKTCYVAWGGKEYRYKGGVQILTAK